MAKEILSLALQLAPSVHERGNELLGQVRAHTRTFGNVKKHCEAQKADAEKAQCPSNRLFWDLVLRYVDGIWTRECRDPKHFTAPRHDVTLVFAPVKQLGRATAKLNARGR
jgi:hypothetical protein